MVFLVWKEKRRSFFPVWALLSTILQPGVAMSRLFLQKAWHELNLEGDDIPDHSLSLLLAVGAWLWFTTAPNLSGHSGESHGPSWLLTALPCLKGVLTFFKMPHPIQFYPSWLKEGLTRKTCVSHCSRLRKPAVSHIRILSSNKITMGQESISRQSENFPTRVTFCLPILGWENRGIPASTLHSAPTSSSTNKLFVGGSGLWIKLTSFSKRSTQEV